MLASLQIPPGSQFVPQGIGEPLIAVRILIEDGVETLIFSGEQNRVGTEILCRLLQARMELAGLRVTAIYRGLPLNRAAFMFSVSELAPALECIKGELEKLRLLGSAQIAWHDPREDTWRVWHSQSGRFEFPADEELHAEQDFLAHVRSALEKLQQSKNEPAGQ
jgi:hypothetical protein